ncbi:hypothetical protein LMG28138_05947 [Pararobbsia alpina]|uniref:Uncharacterized protein n=1 Tax=Pararobbsia alpina TaxID=621374 RepID=A0A6S7CEL8_9BURK|nr:hypothetical protein LMG28138_05947 [Pararobbsia alpina]
MRTSGELGRASVCQIRDHFVDVVLREFTLLLCAELPLLRSDRRAQMGS